MIVKTSTNILSRPSSGASEGLKRRADEGGDDGQNVRNGGLKVGAKDAVILL